LALDDDEQNLEILNPVNDHIQMCHKFCSPDAEYAPFAQPSWASKLALRLKLSSLKHQRGVARRKCEEICGSRIVFEALSWKEEASRGISRIYIRGRDTSILLDDTLLLDTNLRRACGWLSEVRRVSLSRREFVPHRYGSTAILSPVRPDAMLSTICSVQPGPLNDGRYPVHEAIASR
jgi:hypothetical protein